MMIDDSTDDVLVVSRQRREQQKQQQKKQHQEQEHMDNHQQQQEHQSPNDHNHDGYDEQNPEYYSPNNCCYCNSQQPSRPRRQQKHNLRPLVTRLRSRCFEQQQQQRRRRRVMMMFLLMLLLFVFSLFSISVVSSEMLPEDIDDDDDNDGEVLDETTTETRSTSDGYSAGSNCASWSTSTECSWEPNLKAMTVTFTTTITTTASTSSSSSSSSSIIDDDNNKESANKATNTNTINETFYAYITPDVDTFYYNPNDDDDDTDSETKQNKKQKKKKTVVQPSFTGFFGKFINMSPEEINVYWDGTNTGGSRKKRNSKPPVFMVKIEPFGSGGTATYPNHEFIVTPSNDPRTILKRWTMKYDNSLYYYDPYNSNMNIASRDSDMTQQQLQLYTMQLSNQIFAQQYEQFHSANSNIDSQRSIRKRQWLALYKQKKPPQWHMYRADYYGQQYVIETEETHFIEMPHDERELTRGMSAYGPRPDERIRIRQHRSQESTLNLTMTVLSCSPRVFEIPNFLSDVEVQHILALGKRMQLSRSMTYAGQSDTRTSRQQWISRHTDIIIDSIYRRAADLLNINESLLRFRRKTEMTEWGDMDPKISIAEKLQFVHYRVGEQYTPHHDFTMPKLVNHQPSRFATILFYLNDSTDNESSSSDENDDDDDDDVDSENEEETSTLLIGGETTFPRWLNGHTSEPLSIKPKSGKAILFYNMLPDGNYDDLSQHEAKPVVQGEKYLTNLWIWDPVLDHTVADHY